MEQENKDALKYISYKQKGSKKRVQITVGGEPDESKILWKIPTYIQGFRSANLIYT